jgi:hypothetical protein
MASLQTLERRIAALEARLADVEGGYGDTLYKLHRASVKADLRTARILERLERRSRTWPMRMSIKRSTSSNA